MSTFNRPNAFQVWSAVCAVSLICSSKQASARQTAYEYDALGRLVKVEREKSDGSQDEAEYSYDAAGNRVRVQSAVSSNGGQPDPPNSGAAELRIVFNGRFMAVQKNQTN